MREGGFPDAMREQGGNDPVWSYFADYKKVGHGKAVARPSPESFSNISEESKQRDAELLAEKKSKPGLREQHETDADAFAFENYLTAQMKQLHWFEGETMPTTEYDDWVSGVDAVLEWKSDDGPLYLAVDFTVAEKDEAFLKKSTKLEGNVRVKYLRSPAASIDGAPEDLSASMPLVLLGFDKSVFRLVAERSGDKATSAALEKMLVLQAASQIDLQIVMQAHKIFEQSRARRSSSGSEAARTFFDRGTAVTAEEAIILIRGLDDATRATAVSGKNFERFTTLVQLKEKVLNVQKSRVAGTEIDAKAAEVFAKSKTHQVLSS